MVLKIQVSHLENIQNQICVLGKSQKSNLRVRKKWKLISKMTWPTFLYISYQHRLQTNWSSFVNWLRKRLENILTLWIRPWRFLLMSSISRTLSNFTLTPCEGELKQRSTETRSWSHQAVLFSTNVLFVILYTVNNKPYYKI